MAILTGDRYLDLLSTFIEANTGPLLDGGLLLKLNPVGLHYVQSRLDALHELEALRVGAPVDYLRAYVADLGDHRALEQLRRVLRLLGSLKVAAMLPAPARDPTPITVLPFARLRSLELRGCDLSTSAARGLLELRPILERLVCHNSADALRHIFAERTAEIQDAQVWSRLENVSCFGNGMLLMDESLQLLPALEALDLSRNRFAKVANLHKCSKLKFLDAGFNNISTVASLNHILHGITKLVLRNNALVSTRGLQRMDSLEALDLSYNLISNFREVELLSQLPSLRFLWLAGNPLTFCRSYRKEALSYFSDPMKLILDGKQTSRGESYVARRIVARRLKQRSKYGAFSPAQTHESSGLTLHLTDSGEFSDTSSKERNGAGPFPCRVRKKISRLASIQDFTGLPIASKVPELVREGVVRSLASLDAESSALQSDAEANGHMEETVQDLMQQAEVLKRAGSSTWLKDLNLLLENEAKSKSKIQSGQPSVSWQKKPRNRLSRKGSLFNSVSRNPETRKRSGEENEGEERATISLPEGSPRRMSRKGVARYGSGYAGDETNSRVDNLNTANSVDKLLQNSFADGDRRRTLPASPGNVRDFIFKENSGIFTLTEELVTGKIAQGSASPPQFNQDLLHRRQNLERELLQLPPEREASPFYDSESSSETTIYSNLSDSSDSVHNSPSKGRNPFTLADGYGDSEFPSRNRDSEDIFLQRFKTDASVKEAPLSEPHGKDDILEVLSIEGEEKGQAIGLAFVRINNEDDSQMFPNITDLQKISTEDNELSKYTRFGQLQRKSKPFLRVVDLEPLLSSSAENYRNSALPTRVDYHSTDWDVSTNEHRRAMSSGGNSAAGELLRRSQSSSVPISNPSHIVRSRSTDAALGKQPEWFAHENQGDVLSSNSLQLGESHDARDNSRQFHRVRSAVGPVVGQCA